jgi:hypothetical protein
VARGFGGRNGCEALRRRGKGARLPWSGAIDLHESVNPLLPGVTALPNANGVWRASRDIALCGTRGLQKPLSEKREGKVNPTRMQPTHISCACPRLERVIK